MNDKELKLDVAGMVDFDEKCTAFANANIHAYTQDMARLLDVCDKDTLQPVRGKSEWIAAIATDPTELHIQKWIFAWRYIMESAEKVMKVKPLEVAFEEDFMAKENLRYNEQLVKIMKKNEKTCIQRRYAIRFAATRDAMAVTIREKTGVLVSVTRPSEMKKTIRGFEGIHQAISWDRKR